MLQKMRYNMLYCVISQDLTLNFHSRVLFPTNAPQTPEFPGQLTFWLVFYEHSHAFFMQTFSVAQRP